MLRRFWHRTAERKVNIEKVLILLVALGLAVWFAFDLYGDLDRTPATEEERAEIQSMAYSFCSDPTVVFVHDGELVTSDGHFLWSFSTSQMSAKAEYDVNFCLVNLRLGDKGMTEAGAIVTAVVMGFFSWLMFAFALLVAYLIIGTIVVSIVIVIKDIRRRMP